MYSRQRFCDCLSDSLYREKVVQQATGGPAKEIWAPTGMACALRTPKVESSR